MRESENSDDDEDKAEHTELTEAEIIARMSNTQLFAYRRTKLENKKAEISSLSHAVLEDPQNNVGRIS